MDTNLRLTLTVVIEDEVAADSRVTSWEGSEAGKLCPSAYLSYKIIFYLDCSTTPNMFYQYLKCMFVRKKLQISKDTCSNVTSVVSD